MKFLFFNIKRVKKGVFWELNLVVNMVYKNFFCTKIQSVKAKKHN